MHVRIWMYADTCMNSCIQGAICIGRQLHESIAKLCVSCPCQEWKLQAARQSVGHLVVCIRTHMHAYTNENACTHLRKRICTNLRKSAYKMNARTRKNNWDSNIPRRFKFSIQIRIFTQIQIFTHIQIFQRNMANRLKQPYPHYTYICMYVCMYMHTYSSMQHSLGIPTQGIR